MDIERFGNNTITKAFKIACLHDINDLNITQINYVFLDSKVK